MNAPAHGTQKNDPPPPPLFPLWRTSSVDNLKAALRKFTVKQDDESDNNGATLEKEPEVDPLKEAQERLAKTAATLSGEDSSSSKSVG